jgi:NTE family protein
MRMKYFLIAIVVLMSACATTTPPVVSAPDNSGSPNNGATTGQTTGIAPPPVVVPKVPPRVGLALGGGAARGFAHVGVIQVLEDAGIRPALVAGTSAGSVVAAMYASGKNGAQLQHIAETMEEAAFADWTLPVFSRGMLRGEALARYVNGQVKSKVIEDMPLPLGIVATDLNTGLSVLFRRGDTGTAVRASSAVPAVFQPVKIAGKEYVDGGLVSPVPVRGARQMGAQVIVAVDISSPPEGSLTGGTLEILLQTFSIMGQSINALELKDADVVVRPALQGISSADFSARKRSIEAGRQAMLQALPQLRAAIAAKTN